MGFAREGFPPLPSPSHNLNLGELFGTIKSLQAAWGRAVGRQGVLLYCSASVSPAMKCHK